MGLNKLIQVRVDEDTLDGVNDVLNRIGLSRSAAVRVFIKRIALCENFPFSVNLPRDSDLDHFKQHGFWPHPTQDEHVAKKDTPKNPEHRDLSGQELIRIQKQITSFVSDWLYRCLAFRKYSSEETISLIESIAQIVNDCIEEPMVKRKKKIDEL